MHTMGSYRRPFSVINAFSAVEKQPETNLQPRRQSTAAGNIHSRIGRHFMSEYRGGPGPPHAGQEAMHRGAGLFAVTHSTPFAHPAPGTTGQANKRCPTHPPGWKGQPAVLANDQPTLPTAAVYRKKTLSGLSSYYQDDGGWGFGIGRWGAWFCGQEVGNRDEALTAIRSFVPPFVDGHPSPHQKPPAPALAA